MDHIERLHKGKRGKKSTFRKYEMDLQKQQVVQRRKNKYRRRQEKAGGRLTSDKAVFAREVFSVHDQKQKLA